MLFLPAAKLQNPVDPGAFEFGVERTFEGILFESPLTVLQISETGSKSGMGFLLVGSGKLALLRCSVERMVSISGSKAASFIETASQ